ncbi:hypothetical protein GP486_004712 [Trichoglossum hirsutum]|uniref:Uncharacterized protein n=1 Tax=Trichoglossum hirsutum TaxID=265104 RepID=A0A9P8LAM5_9PEZI|nr:hypothetical protein GP486_004712 [Trichoglossum hirsutum]
MPDASVNPKWLSDVKRRVGYCICFGLNPQQVQEAGSILQEVANDWRDLVAGSEGYLTGIDRRGLFKHEIAWGDMTLWQQWLIFSAAVHVNNVVYNRYAESARVKWLQNFAIHIDPTHSDEWNLLATPNALGLILQSIETVYKFPLTWPDHISVYHKLRPFPADPAAFDLDVIILSELHQRPAARCSESLLVYNYQSRQKIPMPSFMRDAFEETLRLQKAAKEEKVGRIQSLLERVTKLEKESWDREGAKEDMGSGASR